MNTDTQKIIPSFPGFKSVFIRVYLWFQNIFQVYRDRSGLSLTAGAPARTGARSGA
jgi:hypothetical protein